MRLPAAVAAISAIASASIITISFSAMIDCSRAQYARKSCAMVSTVDLRSNGTEWSTATLRVASRTSQVRVLE